MAINDTIIMQGFAEGNAIVTQGYWRDVGADIIAHLASITGDNVSLSVIGGYNLTITQGQ